MYDHGAPQIKGLDKSDYFSFSIDDDWSSVFAYLAD
jgi:hypothetical protein